MSRNVNYTAKVNTSQAEADLSKLDRLNAKVNKSMVTTIRKTAQIGLSVFQAFGGAIDQTYALGIEAALLSIELYTTIATAESLTGVGLLHAGALAASIASLITTIVLLNQGRNEAAGRMQHVTNIFRVLSY